jgi:MFS family permease
MALDKGTLRAHHLALIGMIIGFLAGYDSGVAGGILTFKSFQADFGYSGTAATNRVSALTVGLQILGCFLSCFFAGFVTERVGRRWAVWAFASVFIIGVVLQTAPTNNLGAWYFARLISGLGQGGLSVAVPIFTAEMAPAHIRGRLGSLYQWMYTLGIFTAYWINYVSCRILSTCR